MIFSPRTLPAVGVIFSEPRNIGNTVAINKRSLQRLYVTINRQNHRTKRDILPSFSEIRPAIRNINSRIRSELTKAWNHLQRFRVWVAKNMYQKLPRSLKRIVKKVGRIESILHKKMLCLKPRLKRRYGRLVYPEGLTIKALVEQKKEFFQDIKSGSPDNDHVEFVEDCFDDMERPKFGWRVKVTLMQNEPCNLNPENPELNTCTLPLKTNNETDSDLNSNNAQRRQTGEQFRSAAPLDCRIKFVCDANNQVEGNVDLNNNENTPPSTPSPTLAPTPSPTLSTILSSSPTPSPTFASRPSPTVSLSPTPSPPPPTLSPTPSTYIYSYNLHKNKEY